jgi:protein gp37
MDKRWGKVQWGPQGERKRTSDANWQEPLRWQRKAAADSVNPRRRVFCSSLADIFEHRTEDFDGDLLDTWRTDLWALIRQTPNLDWLLLTKRPQNIVEMTPAAWRTAGRWPHNVWLGTSVESQEYADKRIPELLHVGEMQNFLSIEPLLGPIDITPWIGALQWVIVGGESGPNARPMQPEWVRSLCDQCTTAGVPFFFKQWGGVHPTANGHTLDGKDWHEFPEFLHVPLGYKVKA